MQLLNPLKQKIMASTNETGHTKNVANFDELIGFRTGYGAAYNPSKASIKLAALSTFVATLNTSLLETKIILKLYI